MSSSTVGDPIQPPQYQHQNVGTLNLVGPGKVALIALGVIAIIGGGIAAGVLYSHLGYLSLSCLGTVPVGIALLVVGTRTGVSTTFKHFYEQQCRAAFRSNVRYINWMTVVREWHHREKKRDCLLSKQEQRLLRLTFPVAGTITKKDQEMLKECGIVLDESLFREATDFLAFKGNGKIEITQEYGTLVEIGSREVRVDDKAVFEISKEIGNKHFSYLLTTGGDAARVDTVIVYAQKGVELSDLYYIHEWKPSKLILVNAKISDKASGGGKAWNGQLGDWHRSGNALDQSTAQSVNEALEAPLTDKPRVFCV